MQLIDNVKKLPFVGSSYETRLQKLDIYTIDDLINHIPSRYVDFSNVVDIKDTKLGDVVTVKGEIVFLKNQYTHSGKRMQLASVKDKTGELKIFWFNQPFLLKTLYPGTKVSLSGKVSDFGGQLALVSPEYEKFEKKESLHTGALIPVYPETKGVTSKWLRSKIKYALENTKGDIDEFLPRSLIEKESLVHIKRAYTDIHFPKDIDTAEKSRKRLAFNEFLFLHLSTIYKKIEWKKRHVIYKMNVDRRNVENNFIKKLPFTLTDSQKRSIEEILKDLGKNVPMNRLLEGDVGSGKTVVAAAGAFATFLNGYQTAIMAPTQILAEQHYKTLKMLFKEHKVRVKLITAAGVKADEGVPDIIVGTHSLIHKTVNFRNVAYVVIDEQHRFGVEQRAHLTKKVGEKLKNPHSLTMTATPIPRTIALTLYGDLDLSILDELPKGRKPIKTIIVSKKKREDAYGWIKKMIKEECAQVFVICPLIDESEREGMEQVKAATEEYERLKNIFDKFDLGLLHGKQKAEEKNKIISDFRKKKYDILVSTPVIEVGIDIPNATIMVIETAERFGLAQLHQLRGRVGRGESKSYCLLFSERSTGKSRKRLEALSKTNSGFKLAELDLQIRGPGEVFGIKQHGFTNFKAANWSDTKLLKTTKDIALDVIEKPKKFKSLYKYLEKKRQIAN
ncbi:ATP-dependent DNA helicase RecG [Candidatus Woesebacteria bacterium]|nr:ATP-dependent DNA helicase RecG [Candidatus Woesebacteria bacterium]